MYRACMQKRPSSDQALHAWRAQARPTRKHTRIQWISGASRRPCRRRELSATMCTSTRRSLRVNSQGTTSSWHAGQRQARRKKRPRACATAAALCIRTDAAPGNRLLVARGRLEPIMCHASVITSSPGLWRTRCNAKPSLWPLRVTARAASARAGDIASPRTA